MAAITLAPPAPDELEVSIFGPGYGECVVVHLGDGEWLINDSCVDTTDEYRYPVGLRYLRKIGVQPDQVRVIIASHWHDDHVRGLAQIVEACPQAKFFCSMAVGSDQFLRLLEVAHDLDLSSSFSSGVSELKRIIQLRGAPGIRFAMADTTLWKNRRADVSAHSLAPSSASITAGLLNIGMLVDDVASSGVRVPSLDQNDTSVVTWIDFGETRVLLGGDLENDGKNTLRGWLAITGSDTRPSGKADIYKVAHHGSKTSHLDEIWTSLLEDKNVSVIAPYRKGVTPIPTIADLDRISKLSGHTYLTSAGPLPKPVKRSKVVMDVMASATRNWQVLEPPTGHVQLRRLPNASWVVGLSDRAARYSTP